MIIIGAGLAGLLCANMLSRRRPMVIEAQPQLPNNHSAVLRFRSTVVGDVLGIPFRKVNMIKCPVPWRNNPVTDSLAYSYKCTRQYLSDRSITSGFVTTERYIAPPDLIQRMAEDIDISYNQRFEERHLVETKPPIISTLPMLNMMRMLKWPDIPEFHSISGINIKATIENADAYVSLLIPDPLIPASRISITGNELIIEMPLADINSVSSSNHLMEWAVNLLGLKMDKISNISIHQQLYAKIVPIDEDIRKRFIAWATDHHNIYSLGRYATWRPSLLLDDLVKDIRHIEKWINRPDHYALKKHRGG